jgi:nuclear transport factor 2 (NTF2) superfamily protein
VIAKAYTPDSIWRNRSSFVVGTAAIEDLLTKKWAKEKNYVLRKELFAFTDNKIAVQFWYEYQDSHDGMKWKRCYGLEDWTFADDGKMRKRQMSGNDVEISEAGKISYLISYPIESTSSPSRNNLDLMSHSWSDNFSNHALSGSCVSYPKDRHVLQPYIC